jgi:hypothetical protein
LGLFSGDDLSKEISEDSIVVVAIFKAAKERMLRPQNLAVNLFLQSSLSSPSHSSVFKGDGDSKFVFCSSLTSVVATPF